MIDELIAVTGFDGRFKQLNPAWETVLGYSRQELQASPFLDFVHPDDVAATRAMVAALVQDGRTVGFENRYRCKDGSYRWLSWNATPALEDQLIFAVAQDVTARKLAADQLAAANLELTRSNQELEQFAYGASHDLQEPLRMVSSFTQLLAERYEGQLDEKGRKYIAFAVDGAVRMQRLINDLLDYSRVTTKGGPPAPTDSKAILGEALTNLTEAIAETSALVTSGDLPTVSIDRAQLLQLFQNLVGNALKFHGQQPPRVHVSARDLGKEWRFSVEDNGIGLEPRFAERIFVIFQRLHTREEYPGTGIGLALCKRIVERRGGHIWVESVPGAGAKFFFTVPK